MASALIDTNLVLLLVVGATNRKYIGQHKRTRIFTGEDYDQLLSLLGRFETLWVTSHCLAEVSNLLKQTDKRKAKELFSTLSFLGDEFRESHIPKSDIFRSRLFNNLGVADTGFVQKSKRVDWSLTMDLDLYRTLKDKGRKVLNFNHVRGYLYEMP